MKEKEYKPQPEESKVEEPATAYGIDTLSLEELRKEVDKEMEDYYNGVPGYTLEETLRDIKKIS